MPGAKNVNKLVVNGVTKLDLTGDTVDANKILSGYKAHDKSGAQITGALQTEAGSATTNGTYTPSSGKFFSSFSVNTQTYFGENLHNPATDTPEKYVSSGDGQLYNYADWVASDFIEVDNTSFYSLNRWTNDCACYDAQKRYVDFWPDNRCLIQFSDSRVKYFRTSYSTANMAAFVMQKIISGEIVPVYDGSVS